MIDKIDNVQSRKGDGCDGMGTRYAAVVPSATYTSANIKMDREALALPAPYLILVDVCLHDIVLSCQQS
jgi:hypothetical protein